LLKFAHRILLILAEDGGAYAQIRIGSRIVANWLPVSTPILPPQVHVHAGHGMPGMRLIGIVKLFCARTSKGVAKVCSGAYAAQRAHDNNLTVPSPLPPATRTLQNRR